MVDIRRPRDPQVVEAEADPRVAVEEADPLVVVDMVEAAVEPRVATAGKR